MHSLLITVVVVVFPEPFLFGTNLICQMETEPKMKAIALINLDYVIFVVNVGIDKLSFFNTVCMYRHRRTLFGNLLKLNNKSVDILLEE